MSRLEAELTAKGKQKLFDHLKVFLTAEANTIPYSEVATKVDMNEGTVRLTVHRMRKRCRELLRDEIGQTVTSESQIDDEIRGLFKVLG